MRRRSTGAGQHTGRVARRRERVGLAGRGCPYPARRTFAPPLQGSAHSRLSALRHPWLRLTATPPRRVRTAPHAIRFRFGHGAPGVFRGGTAPKFDARVAGNPWRFLPATKQTKARRAFVQAKASCSPPPPHDAAVVAAGNPWRFLPATKQTKARRAYVQAKRLARRPRRTMRRSSPQETLGVSCRRPSKQRPWMALFA
jgi:hypothetical protein